MKYIALFCKIKRFPISSLRTTLESYRTNVLKFYNQLVMNYLYELETVTKFACM